MSNTTGLIFWRGAWRTPLQGGAPDPIMITVKGPDGKDFQAPLPEGFLPSTAVERDYIPRAAHDSEFAKFRTRAAEELMKDPDFRGRALTAWEIDQEALKQFQAQGGKGGKGGKPDPAVIEELTRKLQTEQVEPLQAKLTESEQREAGYVQGLLERSVIDAALAVGVDPALLQAPTPGGVPPIVNFFSGLVAWDDEHQGAFACDPTNDEFRLSGKRREHGEPQYETVQELLEAWAKDPKNARYITNARQRGANFQRADERGGRSGAPRVIDGSDPREFGANLEAIAKGDVIVRVPGLGG